MNRADALKDAASAGRRYDFLIVGGGATGLGAAVDAAARGYRPLLVEQHDFAKATSSRSTKLIHGGVRYLKQGDISLVLESLRERGLLCANAPHLVHHLPFVVPVYSWWEGPFYGIGLKIYDRLAGKLGLEPSEMLSVDETLARIPTLEPGGLQGGVCYFDAQFDDSRLAISLAQTVFDLGGTALNYARVIRLSKENGLVSGAVVRDGESGGEFEVRAKAVINATGVFCDSVREMDEPGSANILTVSQGAHLVLPRRFLPGESAMMVPHTPDGRVLFAIPWHDHVVVGTTDVPVSEIQLEPAPMAEEIEFLLTTASRYLAAQIERSDVLSAFAGLRPLAREGRAKTTAAISREHVVLISGSGLITIAGGKWTTYRKMAEDVIDQAEGVAGLENVPCRTAQLRVHGWTSEDVARDDLHVYGTNATKITQLEAQRPELAARLHPSLRYTGAEVIWAVQNEMARNVEDVLARRTRALFLDARASIEAAPKVARLMAVEMGRDESWERQVVAEYTAVAERYVL